MSTGVERYLSIPLLRCIENIRRREPTSAICQALSCTAGVTFRARASPMCGHISEPSFLDRRSSRHSMSATRLSLAFYGLRRALRAMRRPGGSLLFGEGPGDAARAERTESRISVSKRCFDTMSPYSTRLEHSIVVVRARVLGRNLCSERPRPVLIRVLREEVTHFEEGSKCFPSPYADCFRARFLTH